MAALAALAVASATLAGGSAQVTVTDPPVDPPAGSGTTIELRVLQHGVTAVSWPHVMVIATNGESGEVVHADARAEGPTGSYIANVVFPSAGRWALTFASPELEMEGTAAVSVVAAAPVAAAVAQPDPNAPGGPFVDVVPLLLVIVVSAAALAVAGLLVRNGRGARMLARN